MGLEASRARALNDSLLIAEGGWRSRVLTTKDGWPQTVRPVGSAEGGLAERRGPAFEAWLGAPGAELPGTECAQGLIVPRPSRLNTVTQSPNEIYHFENMFA